MFKFDPWAIPAAVAIVLGFVTQTAAGEVTVAATAIVDNPSLDAARNGLRFELEEAGYEVGRNLTFLYETAQGSPATAAQIARKFVGLNADVIVPISTPSAQAVVAVTEEIPIVFSAVTDPLRAKLVASLHQPGRNVTGTTDLLPIKEQLALIQRITPNVTRLGVLYNPGEANSVTLVELIKGHAAAMGLTVVEGPSTKSAEVLSVTRNLASKVDAFYVPTDSTVVPALEAVVKVGVNRQLPVYAGDTDSVERGAIAALGFNYFDVGRETGKLVLRVLAGEEPGSIAVRQGVRVTQLHVNPGMARKMGVTVPDDVLAEAAKIAE